MNINKKELLKKIEKESLKDVVNKYISIVEVNPPLLSQPIQTAVL